MEAAQQQVTETNEAQAPVTAEQSGNAAFWSDVMAKVGGEPTQETAQKTEEVPAPVEEKKPEADDDSKTLESLDRFKLLTRQEQKNKKMRDEFEAQRKKFEEEKANYLSKSEIEQLAKEDPIAFAEKFGINFEDALRAKMAKENKDPSFEVKSLKEEIKALKEMINKQKEETVEQQLKKEQEVHEKSINEYKNYIGTFLDKNMDKYEYVAELPNAKDEIFDAWYGVAQKTGTPPSLEEIVTKVNEFARNQIIENAKKSKILPKLVKELGLIKEETKPEPSFSLSDKIPSSPAASKPLEDLKRIPTDEERIQAAVAALEMARGAKK